MGAASFFGHALLGLGPGLAFFLVVLAPKSFVVLLTLASAFLWLTVLLLVSAVLRPWAPLPFSGDARAAAGALLAAVAVEEVVRLGVVAAHSRMCAVLRRMAAASPGHTFGRADELLLALAWGYGQAAVHGLFIFASLLPLTAGHGTLYVDVCPAMSVLLVAALNCLALGATLSALSVIALEAWARQRRMGAAYAPLAHAGAALLVRSSAGGPCVTTVTVTVAAVNVLWPHSLPLLPPAPPPTSLVPPPLFNPTQHTSHRSSCTAAASCPLAHLPAPPTHARRRWAACDPAAAPQLCQRSSRCP